MLQWKIDGKRHDALFSLWCGEFYCARVFYERSNGWRISPRFSFYDDSFAARSPFHTHAKSSEAVAECEAVFRAWLDLAGLKIKGD